MEINREMLLQSFRMETEECLAEMEQSLLALETHPDDRELIASLFRAAHTIKGNASLLDFTPLARFLHSLEDLLDLCRSHAELLTHKVINTLLQSVDALRQMTKRAVAGEEGLLPEHELLSAQLAEMTGEFNKTEAPAAVESPASLFPATADGAAVAKAAVQNLRVDVAKLDRMLNLTVEFAIGQGRLRRGLEEKFVGTAGGSELLETQHGLEALFLDLQELVMKIRMVPVGPTFHRFARSVRDTARKSGKLARMLIVGEAVEVDTTILEQIHDPLMHMIRNSVDHGLESPESRRAAGKDPSGKIVLKAFHDSGSIVV
jgi:two-component system chemotaxis sensor kinase CheA